MSRPSPVFPAVQQPVPIPWSVAVLGCKGEGGRGRQPTSSPAWSSLLDIHEHTHCESLVNEHSRSVPSSLLIQGRALLTLATAGGYQSLDSQSCLVLTSRLFSESAGLAKGSTQRQLLWMLLQAKAKMLSRAQQQQQSCAVEQVRRLSALIAHCQLPSTEALMSLQMKVGIDL